MRPVTPSPQDSPQGRRGVCRASIHVGAEMVEQGHIVGIEPVALLHRLKRFDPHGGRAGKRMVPEGVADPSPARRILPERRVKRAPG